MESERRHSLLCAWLPWTLPGLVLLLWMVVSETGMVPDYLLPPPMTIGKAGYHYIFGKVGDAPYAGRFLRDLPASLTRVGCGFACAVAMGLPLGIVSGRVAAVRMLLSNPVNALRAVPGISLLPLAMVWFGIGIKTTVFLVALAAFFPIYLNAAAGTRQVDPLLLQAGAMLGVGRWRSVFGILIPAAMPHIITGLRLGLGIAWAYLVLGELSGVPDGLGAIIMDARMLGRTDIIIVGIIIIAVIGRASDHLLSSFLRLCFKSAGRMV